MCSWSGHCAFDWSFCVDCFTDDDFSLLFLPQRSYSEILAVNAQGTYNVITACREARVPSLIYTRHALLRPLFFFDIGVT